eukprot:5037906-Prymnesium_polylepis.2
MNRFDASKPVFLNVAVSDLAVAVGHHRNQQVDQDHGAHERRRPKKSKREESRSGEQCPRALAVRHVEQVIGWLELVKQGPQRHSKHTRPIVVET